MDTPKSLLPSFVTKMKKKTSKEILADAIIARDYLLERGFDEAAFKEMPAGMMLCIDFSSERTEDQCRVKFEQMNNEPIGEYCLKFNLDDICGEFGVSKFIIFYAVSPSLCPAFRKMLMPGFAHQDFEDWCHSIRFVAANIGLLSAKLIAECRMETLLKPIICRNGSVSRMPVHR